MQFRKGQREQIRKTWNAGSWFYKNLGLVPRATIEYAYGIRKCDPKTRTQAQESVTFAMAIFAQRLGVDKSHVVHGVLTGSLDALQRAIIRNAGDSDEDYIRHMWEASFRDVAQNSI